MGVSAVAAGIDTWSPAWYVRDAASLDQLCALATVRTARGFMLPEPIDGHRVGVVPGVGLLWAEGHPDPAGLACPDHLPAHLARLTAAMLDAGLPLPGQGRYQDGSSTAGVDDRDGFAGIRRLDSTVDLRFDTGAEGLATLAGVAGLLRGSPRAKLAAYYATDGRALETVYCVGANGQKQARWYDKGVESGEASRGRWIRPEDQRRFVKATRRGPDELGATFVQTKFRQRFAALWQASKGVTVAGPIVLVEKIDALVQSGDLTYAQARVLAGHLVLQSVQRHADDVPERTRRRLDRACRDRGLVLADGVMQEVEISLQDVLEEVLDSPAWGAQG